MKANIYKEIHSKIILKIKNCCTLNNKQKKVILIKKYLNNQIQFKNLNLMMITSL